MVTVPQTPVNMNTSGRSVYLFPFSYPDELHASQASRYHIHSGNRDVTTTFKELYGSRPFRITSIIPPNIERFAEKLPDQNPQRLVEILRENTLAPLFETLSGISISDLSRQTNSRLKGRKPIPMRTVGQIGNVQLCLDCLRDDLASHGEPYIHRSHQIPGISCCYKHGTTLVSRCPICRNPFESQKHFDLILLPWQRCHCGTLLSEINASEYDREHSPVEIALARYGMELINHPTKPVTAELLANTYKARLVELGFNRKSVIDKKSVFEGLVEHYGEDLLLQCDYALRSSKDQVWLRLHHASSTHEVPITRHILLGSFLFGNGAGFFEYLSHQESLIRPLGEPGRRMRRRDGLKKEIPIVELDSKEKKVIVEVLSSNPRWSLDDLWENKRAVLRKLLKGDGQSENLIWLKSLFEAKTEAERVNSTSVKSQHPNDELWAEKIERAAQLYYDSEKYPVKITRNKLLRTVGWKNTCVIDREKYPSSVLKLDQWVESIWHYQARKIIWSMIVNGGEGVAKHKIIEPVYVEHHRGKYLVGLFSSMPADVVMMPKVVMDWLSYFEIGINWMGPEDQGVFCGLGRRYKPQKDRIENYA